MCSIYYLAALRTGADMAEAVGDSKAAQDYRDLYERGSQWIDANLFNGEFYVQRIRGIPATQIAPSLRGGMGAEDTEKPDYQVGDGCLIDQLVGQYLADAGNLGALVSAEHIRKTLGSIDRYNAKPTLIHHDNVARTYALNDEAAVVVCDYGNADRPRIPFPYYSEVFTGLEYTLAALMINWGMVNEGIECVRNTRMRYDGEKRNPWDEAECGHHYARAMSSWSTVLALSGFAYDGAKASLVEVPRLPHDRFDCFWAAGTGWGTFSYRNQAAQGHFILRVIEGNLLCRSFEITAKGNRAVLRNGNATLAGTVEQRSKTVVVDLQNPLSLASGETLQIEVGA